MNSRFIEAGKITCKTAQIAVWNECREFLARFSRHLLVDPLQALHEASDVVIPVAVLPNVFDDLGDRARLVFGRLGGYVGCLSEVFKQRAIETVEYDEMGFVRIFARLSACPGRASARRGCGTSPGAGRQ